MAHIQSWGTPASFSPAARSETPPAPPVTPPLSPAASTSLWTGSGAPGLPGRPAPQISSVVAPAVMRELRGGRGPAHSLSTGGGTARERENNLGTAFLLLVLVGPGKYLLMT